MVVLFLLLIIPAAAANPLPPPQTITTPEETITAGLASAPSSLDWTRVTPDVPFPARQGHSTVVFDGSLWVIGGNYPAGSWPYYNDVWKSDDGITWTQVTPYAAFAKRYGHGSVVFDDRIWVIGGRDGSTRKPLNDVWYSPDGVTWTQATSAAPFDPRWDFGITVYDGKMWVIGGSANDGTPVNDVWYSGDGRTWKPAVLHAGFSPRMEPSAITHDGKIWVTGGFDWRGVYNDLWTTDDGVHWTRVASHAPFPARRYQQTEVADGKLWVIGGSTLDNTINDVWYTTDGITWTQAAGQRMFTPRYAFTTASFNDRLWVIGGTTGNDVWYSDPVLPAGPATAPGASGDKPAILIITKTVAPSSIKTGTDSTVIISVTNRGPLPVYDVEVLDPANTDFPIINGTGQVSYPAIEANETKTITYTIHALKAGSYQLNRTTAMYAEQDGNYRIAYSGYSTIRVMPSLLAPEDEGTPNDPVSNLIAWINSIDPFK